MGKKINARKYKVKINGVEVETAGLSKKEFQDFFGNAMSLNKELERREFQDIYNKFIETKMILNGRFKEQSKEEPPRE